jgi:von Hippel-Lindau disease tumor supressor
MRSFFTALVFSLLLAAPASAQYNCPEERGLRSANSDQPTSITFVNRLREEVQLFWIDFQGAKQRYARIAPGQSFTQQTYVTHPWAVYNRHGECLGVYFPEAAPRRVRLAPVG